MKQQFFFHHRSLEFILLIALITSCVGNKDTTNLNPLTPTLSATPTASMTPTVTASPIPDFTTTPIDTKPVWEIIENWTLANQIRAMLIDQSGDLWTGGPAGVVHWDLKTNTPTVYAIRGDPQNTNVIALSQTPDGAIWAGTFGNGLAKFDGKNWNSFTSENGLPGNYINDQTVTPNGELWLVVKEKEYDYEPNQKIHLGYFDGITWFDDLNVPNFNWLVASPNGSLIGGQASETYNPPNSNLGIYDGHTWVSLVYSEQENNPLRGKGITAITVAPDEVVWVATWYAVFRYENDVWVKIVSPLDGENLPHVSSMAVSANGTAWFGFSADAAQFNSKCGHLYPNYEEQGVYRYDGKTWTHFTAENGLVDNKICAITIDANNNVWFGSYDKGVSRFDEQTWASFVIP